MASKRKPYIREMDAGWWKNNPFYRFYMLRECTSVFAVWVSLLLIYSLVNPAGFFKLVSNPVIILINIVALMASLLHTKTWFDLAPKAVNLDEKKNAMLVKGLWGAMAAATAVILLLVFTA